MTCKPESQKQRLERTAAQILAGYNANPIADEHTHDSMVRYSIEQARELIKQIDELSLIE